MHLEHDYIMTGLYSAPTVSSDHQMANYTGILRAQEHHLFVL